MCFFMVKLYFLGGENVAKQDAKNINVAAFEDAGGMPQVLVFPWARPSFDQQYKRRQRLTNYFRSMGAKDVSYADFSETPAELAAKTEHADLIYLTGGQVSTLLSRLQKAGADQLLRRFEGVIVGRSAGALVLGRKCLVTNRCSGSPKVVEGLGLVDFSVKVHYKSFKDHLLRQLSMEEKVYAIPQRAAVVYDEGELQFMGAVFLFEHGEKTLITDGAF
jgi:dipeptidase E